MNRRRWDPSVERPWNPTEVPLGTHIVVERGRYEHHCLYIGGGRIIEYDKDRGVRIQSLADCVGKYGYWAVSDGDRVHPALFSGAEAVARARRRLGEDHYDAGENNCEHFVNWTLSGHHHCDQTDSGYLWIFGLVSWLCPKDATWHRERLAAKFPREHEAASQRQDHWRSLIKQGSFAEVAAAMTRQTFGDTAPRPDDNRCARPAFARYL
jgi:hypothetical protein